jgi:hypothetical protein
MKSASPARDPVTQTGESQFVVSWCSSRRLIITENGFLGPVSKGAFIGDEVYVLFGDVPRILLPTAEGKEFQFAGHCYIHGIVDGKAVRSTQVLG